MPVPPNLVPAVDVSVKYDWNSLVAGQYICVERVDRNNNLYILGRVDRLERLRNCHMLHMEVEKAFDDLGFELSRYQFQRLFPQAQRHSYPFRVEWKKPKNASVFHWASAVPITQAGAGGTSTRSSRRQQRSQPNYAYTPPPPPPVDAPTVDRLAPDLDDLLKKRAEQRRAHAQHRALLQEARMGVGDALRLLGLTYESGFAEFKTVRRKLMLEFHPDLETQHVLVNGETAREEFRERSRKIVEALALVLPVVQSNAN
jgi:hypothetical protein